VNERSMMRRTGHKSAEMAAKNIRIGELYTRNAVAGLGITQACRPPTSAMDGLEASRRPLRIERICAVGDEADVVEAQRLRSRRVDRGVRMHLDEAYR
jgi:hypothetical protein